MKRKRRGVGTGFEETRLRVGQTGGGAGGRLLEAGALERSKVSVRLRGSKGRGPLEVNSKESSRSGLRVLALILLSERQLLVFWVSSDLISY